MIRVVKVNKLRTPEERAGVCYCGRAFAGWKASKWGNPFKPKGMSAGAITQCLIEFREYAEEYSRKHPEWLADLWEACEHGAKPLGCWCIDATHGDGQATVCHAQILAAMLHERFIKESK